MCVCVTSQTRGSGAGKQKWERGGKNEVEEEAEAVLRQTAGKES